jgi:ubiquinone/menaquinone biosynthesis C-methylase UbiE
LSGSEQTKVSHPLFARAYLWLSVKEEEAGRAEHRDEALAGLSGRVVELGAGNGLNFAHYPETVDEVVAVEPEPVLREHAERAAADAGVRVTVVDGVADALPLEDESVDAAVASLVLCSVPDQALALAEVRRVLRPGGELRFYEHVLSRARGLARFQRFSDATYWPHISGGCHMARDTAAAIERAGFEIEAQRRWAYRPSPILPPEPMILGVARRPA